MPRPEPIVKLKLGVIIQSPANDVDITLSGLSGSINISGTVSWSWSGRVGGNSSPRDLEVTVEFNNVQYPAHLGTSVGRSRPWSASIPVTRTGTYGISVIATALEGDAASERRQMRINVVDSVKPIEKKYQDLGGVNGFLGPRMLPSEQLCPDAQGRYMHYQGGSIYWTAQTGAHEVHGHIRQKWADLGWERSLLGYPVTDETATPDRVGRFNHFQGGSIYWTPAWGAFVVHGLIRARWAELNWEQGYLGFPVSDELDMPGGGKYNVFEHGIITWQAGQGMAVDGPHHYERIYAHIRAQILERFFAIGAKGRRNHFSTDSNLKGEVSSRPKTDAEKAEAEKGIWRKKQDGGENPFLFGSHLYIMLAIEHHFGNPESTRALKAGLATIESLFAWHTPGDPSSRLPIRWDAGMPTDKESEADQFLLDSSGRYSAGIASTDIHHFPRRSEDTLKNLIGPEAAAQYKIDQNDENNKHQNDYVRFRMWELSMDEVNGLVTIYWIINKLSQNVDISATVRRQAQYLGNYLANNGYILVRPMGGLSWRGSTGILPALEYPYSRVLSNVAGIDASSRADFRQAMEKAGYWRNLVGPITNWQVLGWTLAGAMASLAPALRSVGLGPDFLEQLLAGQILSPSTIGGALAVLLHSDCFDVAELDAPAVALILKEAPNKPALYALLARLAALGPKTSPGVYFHSWIGLTGVDDVEPTVREAFNDWYNLRRLAVQGGLEEPKSNGVRSIFSHAVAVLTGAHPAGEQELVNLIELAIVENYRDCYFEPKLTISGNNGINGVTGGQELCWVPHWEYAKENSWEGAPHHPMDLCVGLALAFWHAQRRHDTGNPVNTPRFPEPLNINRFPKWPIAAVPKTVVDDPEKTIPVREIQGTDTPHLARNGYPLFDEPLISRHPIPVSKPFAAATALLCNVALTVRAQDKGDIPTGITLHPGLEFDIHASGTVWAGVITDPRNGPNGHNRLIDDARWPLHTGLDPRNAKAFCLLGRLNGYFYIGENLARQSFRYPKPRPLFLRINDNNPGDGNGEFTVQIRVWGPPGFDPTQAGLQPVYLPPPDLVRDGGLLSTNDSVDQIDVSVEQGYAAADVVVFRLETPSNITWRKEIIIKESPAVGSGAWTIFTKDNKHDEENALYMYQMNGATLTFRKLKDFITDMAVVRTLDVSTAYPGSRITFKWVKDS